MKCQRVDGVRLGRVVAFCAVAKGLTTDNSLRVDHNAVLNSLAVDTPASREPSHSAFGPSGRLQMQKQTFGQ